MYRFAVFRQEFVAVYLLSRWYTRRELAFRSAILYGGLLISNAFGAVSRF